MDVETFYPLGSWLFCGRWGGRTGAWTHGLYHLSHALIHFCFRPGQLDHYSLFCFLSSWLTGTWCHAQLLLVEMGRCELCAQLALNLDLPELCLLSS
jgi:hypothetical protein